MSLHEIGLRIYRHYSYDFGWGETYYSESKPLDPKAQNVTFIEDGQQIDNPIQHGGIQVAKIVHRDNGTGTLGPLGHELPIAIEALPGQEKGLQEVYKREAEI